MDTQEEKLKMIYDNFGKEMKKIAEETIGNVVSDFIPYAEDDLDSNVYSFSQRLIQNFLTDKPTYDWENIKDNFVRFNSAEVRRKMFVDYREEITNQILLDQEIEIIRLNEHVKWLDSLNESYRRF